MKIIKMLLLMIALCCFGQSQAQNITGVWEGEMSDEFLRINIQQDGNALCGYTFDVLRNDKSSYCKSYFTGKYDKKNDRYVINGVKFIENSGDHVLMTMKLWFPQNSSNKNQLYGNVTISSSSLLSAFLDEGDFFKVKKVADQPVKPGKYLPVCYEYNPPMTNKVKEINPPKEKTTTQKNTEITIQKSKINQKDSMSVTPQRPIVEPIKKDPPVSMQDKALTNEMNSRKNNSVSTIKVNVEKIQIRLYDNGTIDNDSVSIFYNGRLLKKHEKLSDSPLVVDLELDKSVKEHQIVVFAENLGSLPPNTALIVVTAGKKRYELHSSASLNENAVLNFEYEP